MLYENQHIEAGLIERVKLGYATDLETYPSGVRYSMHIGTLDDMTLLRYDNAHEATKGHEKILPWRRRPSSFQDSNRCWSSSTRRPMSTGEKPTQMARIDRIERSA